MDLNNLKNISATKNSDHSENVIPSGSSDEQLTEEELYVKLADVVTPLWKVSSQTRISQNFRLKSMIVTM